LSASDVKTVTVAFKAFPTLEGMLNQYTKYRHKRIKHIIIIIIGTTALFEPRPSSEASASRPYSLHHSSSFSLPSSWHPPSRRPPIVVLAYPFALIFFKLVQQHL
jgi:hypothetical protein